MLVKKKRTLNFHQGSFYSCSVRLVSCPLCIIYANTSSYFIHILNNRTCSELASVIAERANLFAEVIVYAQRFVASNNATHSRDESHNRWLCPLCSISANASACFSLRLRSAAQRAVGKHTQCRLPTKRSFVSSPLPHEKKTTLSDCLFWCGWYLVHFV